ncbi:hypothetical protein A1359_20955 [Methylomonas lenta]|uniref:Exosortase n=1 Tax=Methylomonas lenta TaxID=980561 RepID=A0A177NT38_9GAMM|nr:hypothetical protein [Methylomonas lenta]OAI20379.1 hypothetical protein A1359_20955 [Methylomonas lenta]
MNIKLINGLLFGALAGMSQVSSAALTGADEVTVNFPGSIMNQSSYGYGANQVPAAGGLCPETGGAACYVEDGVLIGSPTDGNGTNHLHRTGSITGGGLSDKALAYHGDSSGIYIRALDGSAFDLKSMIFQAPIGGTNYIYGPAMDMNNPLSDQPADIGLLGPNEGWEIFGFSSAVNPNIQSTDGYGTAVAHSFIANGFEGLVGTNSSSDFVLDAAFNNVSAVWIHYKGYPITPTDGIFFDMELDNVVLGAPVAAVPVPAAVWLFGTGLLGLVSFGRKKSALSA